MRSSILFTCALALCANLHGQYVTTFLGQPEAIGSGPFETPFPTGGAATARTQYLIHSAELALLPSADLYGIVLEVLDTDSAGTTVDLQVQLKNTVTTCMIAWEFTGLQLVSDTAGLHLDQGLLTLPFNTSLGSWTGNGLNLLVEIGMRRTGGPGLDPRVLLDTSFSCVPTIYAHDTALVALSALNPGTATNSASIGKRPVIGFLTPGSLSVQDGEDRMRVALYPNPAEDRIALRLLNGPDHVNVMLTNALGATVREVSVSTAANGMIDVSLTGLASGCYLVIVADLGGQPLWQQRVVVK
jgi:hypothetical protein